jgi:hypothetical protein
MNKKNIFILLVLGFCLLGSSPTATKLARLTVINKSGRAIELSLTGQDTEAFYYLRIPEGTRQVPNEKIFTIARDTYVSSLFYVELWDPVYGASCSTKAQVLDVNHNVTLIVFDCEITPPNAGDPPSVVKYGGHTSRRGGR